MADYRVLVYAPGTAGTNYGPGSLIADLRTWNNLGWAEYLNGVPEMFLSLSQDDEQLPLIASSLAYGDAHAVILRDGVRVWAGWIGMEWSADQNDVIIYGYGYIAGTYWTNLPWDLSYLGYTVGTVVSTVWTHAKTTTANSTVKFVTTGTIESPVTTSGGGTAITVPKYKCSWKRVYDAIKEMAALSVGGTTNVVKYEITPDSSPTFNFWKSVSTDRKNLEVRYGSSAVKGFTDYRLPVYRRNTYNIAGASPVASSLFATVSNATDITNHGTRSEAMWFTWVRDQTEINRAADLRLAKGIRTPIDLGVSFHADAINPPYSGGTYIVGDRLPVKISRGITQVDGMYLVTGHMTTHTAGAERVHLVLQERSGA